MTQSLRTFIQDPNETLDYLFDWVAWLASDTISTSSWSTSKNDVIVTANTKTNTTATGWVTGGVNGDKVYVTNRITTAGGRTAERSFTLRIKDR